MSILASKAPLEPVPLLISAVKQKLDHPPTWKGKAKGDQPAASGSGSGSQEKKHFKFHAGKQVKE